MRRRALVLLSRDPGGRRTGRKAVLSTIVESLRTLDLEVVVVVIGSEPLESPPPAFAGVTMKSVPAPGPGRAGLAAGASFLTGRRSLNECLYRSGPTRREVADIVREVDPDVIVADMIRCAALVENLDAPVFVDLDDLLSERYRAIATDDDGDSVLGYYEERLPRSVRWAARAVARRLLRRESGVLARREVAVARWAAGVSLVSRREGAELSRRSGVPVDYLPMAFAPPDIPADAGRARPGSFVLTGGLDYRANLVSLRWFCAEVLPLLSDDVRLGFCLTVVGHCPPAVRAELERPGVRLLGYVDDLDAELRRHRGFLAPITSGTGIKTKVLEAMALGLPVVSTPGGVAGLDQGEPLRWLEASDAQTFANAVRRLSRDPALASATGLAGREYVSRQFSPEVLAERWRAALSPIVPSLGRPENSGTAAPP
ncbi:MAG: glycosyltransferase [Dehalococcoidia bacterium]